MLCAMRRLLQALCPALLLAGCTAPASPPAATTPATASTPTTPATPAIPATPAVSTTPATPATPAISTTSATPATPEQPATPEPPAAIDDAPPALPPAAPADARFQLAAYRDGELRLHLLGDAIFVSGAAGLAHLDARGDRLVPVEYALAGQTPPDWYFDEWLLTGLGGRWPDNAWLTTESHVSRSSSPPQLHRREGSFWKPQNTKEGILHRTYPTVITWHSGQVLGLRLYRVDPAMYDTGSELSKAQQRRIDTALARARPGFDLLAATPTPTAMIIAPGLEPITAAAAPTGELFLLARKGRPEAGAPQVQRFGLTGDAAISGTVDALPKGLQCELLAVRAADEAYVACARARGPGRAYLARFNGSTWSEVPAPKAISFVDLSVSPAGELYAVLAASEDARQLWHRATPDAEWAQVDLPELRFADRGAPEWAFAPVGHEFALQPADPEAAARSWPVRPLQVLARPDGDVWVVAETDLQRESISSYMAVRHVVLRAGKVREPLRMLPDGDLALELLDWRPAPAWTPVGCGDEGENRPAFVALRTLPRDAPRNQPEPLLAAFIADNKALMPAVARAVEVFRRGRRTVGFYVQPSDQASADALLAALGRAVPDEPHKLECRQPRIRREFDKTSAQALQAPAL